MHGWVNPRLGIRFDLSGEELQIFRPDGEAFATYLEIQRQMEAERDRATQAESELEQLRLRAERLAQRLRDAGIED